MHIEYGIKRVITLPQELEERLRKRASELYPMPMGASQETKERVQRMRNAYVYGTLRKIEEKK
jgi:hypothetical protein